MPTSFLAADTNFPRLTEDVPVNERLGRIENYLYMLLEELRYTLANLGEENFNEQTLKELGDTLTGPISRTVTDLAGNVSTLEQTAASLTSTVSSLSGDVSTLQQTASSITTTVSNLSGDVSTLQQTASSLTTRVENAEGDISYAQQTANKIEWVVASGTSASNFTLTPHMASLISDEISITGVVTFNDLETAGRSVINGDNIELKADADGDSVSYLTYTSVRGNTFAEVHTRDNRTGTTSDRDRYAFVIETPAMVDGDWCAMKLEAGDSMSLEAGHLLYVQAASQVIIDHGAYPTRITANSVSFIPSSQYCQQTDTYYFCDDGIYFNGTRILST